MEQNPNPCPILDELRQRDPHHDDVLHRHVRTRHEDKDAVLKDRLGEVDPTATGADDGNHARTSPPSKDGLRFVSARSAAGSCPTTT
jgi:hypothetical protein